MHACSEAGTVSVTRPLGCLKRDNQSGIRPETYLCAALRVWLVRSCAVARWRVAQAVDVMRIAEHRISDLSVMHSVVPNRVEERQLDVLHVRVEEEELGQRVAHGVPLDDVGYLRAQRRMSGHRRRAALRHWQACGTASSPPSSAWTGCHLSLGCESSLVVPIGKRPSVSRRPLSP